jgi:hypothetical protein
VASNTLTHRISHRIASHASDASHLTYRILARVASRMRVPSTLVQDACAQHPCAVTRRLKRVRVPSMQGACARSPRTRGLSERRDSRYPSLWRYSLSESDLRAPDGRGAVLAYGVHGWGAQASTLAHASLMGGKRRRVRVDACAQGGWLAVGAGLGQGRAREGGCL